MDRLIEGYHRFRQEHWPRERERFERLAQSGQRPRAMVISCCDSRVDPSHIFDAGPGELFIVRNIANLVPPYTPDGGYRATSAALEFAVRALKVSNVIVMGHALCGGVRVLLDGAPPEVSDFVGDWMKIGERARHHVLDVDPEHRHEACEHAIVALSIDNIRTFPWVRAGEQAGTLHLHGCHFDVRSGILKRADASGRFVPVDEAE